ncbi:MAG: hypothetical protein M0C28_34905 [Candidatus Moduliflexus flocculans]|nr:hypothetical protein [Candidatus Moduliflexus flocculans]
MSSSSRNIAGRGVGGRLYTDLELAAASAQVTQLEVGVRDDCPKCRSFADRNGFSEQRHSIGMTLDLTRFDDRPYEAVISRLQAEGSSSRRWRRWGTRRRRSTNSTR